MIDTRQRDAVDTNQPAPTVEAHPASTVPWILIAALILVQFLLFRQQLIREILWSYPANHDQVNFLYQSQAIYFKMLDSGFWRGLAFGLQHSAPSSFMLPLQGALAFYLFGPERINALTLVFTYFALLQVVLAYTVRRLTGHWLISFVALGLLIGTMSRFINAGGLSDFRADGIASSLYGITLCCFLLSNWTSDQKWSRITACAAALLCWFRPLAGVYLVALAGLGVPFLLYRARFSEGRPGVIALARTWAKPVLLFVLLTLPIPVIGASNLYKYYVVGHFFSSEKQIRALEQGVVTLGDNLLYYPRTLYDYHLGHPVVNLWLFLMGFAAAVYIIGRLGRPAGTQELRPCLSASNITVPAVWAVVPLTILTFNLAKSPLVASISVAPIVLFATFALYRLLQASGGIVPVKLANGCRIGLAAVSILVGMTLMANAEGQSGPHTANAVQIKKLMKAYDDIALYSQNFQLRRLNIATDRVLEYFNGTAAGVIMQERSGLHIEPRELLATNIFARSAEEAVRAATAADCALVTVNPVENTRNSLFPFHQSAFAWQGAYRDVVTSQMAQIAELTMGDHRFQIFLRPRVSIDGNSGGWLTSDGARIAAPARALKVLPIIQFSGSTIGSNHLNGPLGTTVILPNAPGKPALKVPSKATIHPDESYEIQIDLTGTPLPESGQVQMQLLFDRYFVPKDLGINPDPRKLVIQFPKSSALLPPVRQSIGPAHRLSTGDLYP